MSGTEEEFRRFVEENRDLIERMMDLQREGAADLASAGRDTLKEAVRSREAAAEEARARAEEFAREAYSMFTDPEVQRHFMAMGMELIMGISAMMQRAPVPDFVKDAAGTTERTWKTSACRANEDCGARKGPQRVEVSTSEGPTEIKVEDSAEEE